MLKIFSKITTAIIISMVLMSTTVMSFAGESLYIDSNSLGSLYLVRGGSQIRETQATIGTGLYKIDGQWLYYESGKFTAVTGLVQRADTKTWHFVVDGVYQKSTGLVQCVQPGISNGKWYYVQGGDLSKSTGLVKCVQPGISNGKYYYVVDGKLNKSTGLVRCIQPGISNGKYYYVVNGRLSTQSGLVQCIQPGVSNGKWYYVKNGKLNYATGKVKCIQPGTSYGKLYNVQNGKLVKKISVTSNETQGIVTASGGLNVRSGPGTTYSRIGGLNDGATVGILASTSGWYKIKYGSGTGYVNSDYIMKIEDEPKELISESTTTENPKEIIGNPYGTKRFYITSTALIWRDCPFHGREVHAGWDLAIGGNGQPIYSVLDGKVVYSGILPGYGSHVLIIQTGELYTLYGHMSAHMVNKGATVKKGQRVGSQGSEGNATGPHLHLEFRKKNVSGNTTANKENVLPMLSKWAIDYKMHTSEYSRILR